MSLTRPNVIGEPFAYNGDYTLPPTTGSNTDAAVSQEVGYPQTQQTPLGSGGIPINRQQTNGIFNLYTNTLVWLNAGGTFTFDQTIVDTQGGYSEGAVLWAASIGSFVVSLIDNNAANFITNPEYIGDNIHWKPLINLYTPILITESTDWVCPYNVTQIYVTLIGGGGGGAYGFTDNTSRLSGSGGSSGVLIYKQQITVTPLTTYSITIGNGGDTGNSSYSGFDGSPTTAFGLTAAGGKGAGGTNVGGGGGAISGASPGSNGVAVSLPNNFTLYGGIGGSIWIGTGGSTSSGNGATLIDGKNGGGGGGGLAPLSNGTTLGTKGGNGVVLIEYS